MCGIWGIVNKKNKLPENVLKDVIKELMLLSETRGKEATGITILNSEKMAVMKRSMAADKMIKTAEYAGFIRRNLKIGEEILVSGHSRLVTNGEQPQNNQPVVKHKISMVHNGIIVNDEELWMQNKNLNRELEVDTEIMVELFNSYLGKSSVDHALKKVYDQIQGMASTISILSEHRTLIAASNNGSLFYYACRDGNVVLLASEKITLEKIISKYRKWLGEEKKYLIRQLNHREVASWKLERPAGQRNEQGKQYLPTEVIESDIEKEKRQNRSRNNIFGESQYSGFEVDQDEIRKIRRCSRCILPETMPFIQFDEKGVCNYCRTYEKQVYKGEEKLRKWADGIKAQGSQNNCMVSFSGGRDSSYGLHYFVKELGLNPITYCYDWGMVTDLARRNQSRMCSKLGVEFILVSADIKKKRSNIRKNILAWLKKPDLGMIPIFMAGDKHYFYYANKVCKDYGIKNILLASNPFEKTHFKSGFCGIMPDILHGEQNGLDMERLPYRDVLKMAMYYLKQYGGNIAYINSSLLDTFTAAISYYVIPHNYFRLFDYIEWQEKEVNKVLLEEYDWETAGDTKSTWRIGDGTAPFYNYIYYLVAGFTENDTLRSNQIREGMLTRDEALKLVYQDNIPRFESMKWYFDVLDLDMQEVLKRIYGMKRLYE